ncbi:MAG: hypothetical protein NXI22_17150, partial [bacterium]|nr:hypothetical protein [bacterium]
MARTVSLIKSIAPEKTNARTVSHEREQIVPFPIAPPNKPRWGGDLINQMFQVAQVQPDGGNQGDGGGNPPAELPVELPVDPAAGEGEEIVGLNGDTGGVNRVRAIFVPGIDAVILRGPKAEVERVRRLIDEIVNISTVTKPELEIVRLRYVDSQALSVLINEIYDEVLSSRQGQLTIRPLVKPNALLVIGRQESIQGVQEIVQRLDMPVETSTEFEVIRLQHMSSIDAANRITQFYTPEGGEDPVGLQPRVLAVGDYRTNSLIVKASPRDMEEIRRMIARLDVQEITSTKEVRIIRLKNSLAEELAPVIQDAINGQLENAGRGLNADAREGTGGGGADTDVLGRIRSAILTFSTIDSQGGQIIKSGILYDIRITPDVNANALVVTGPADSLNLVEAVIQQLDQLPNAEAQIKVFQVVNGDAVALAESLTELFGTEDNTQGPNTSLQGQSASDSSLIPLRFAVEQRTNSILVSGTRGELAIVEQVMIRLDETSTDQRTTSVFRLRNAPAADVATAVNSLLTSKRELTTIVADTISPFTQIEREVIVVPEQVTNSLIISATPTFYADIIAVVEQLDARPPMVMIQVLIAQVTLNDTEEFGIELGIQDSLVFDRGVGVVGFPFNQSALGNNSDALALGTAELLAGQALSNLSVGRTNATLGYGGLVLSAGNESINVLLRALEDNQRVQMLSRPQVMTLDNQPAFVQVGQRVPTITDVQQTVNGTVNSVTYQNVGILLGITPRTSPDGLVVMEVNAEKSALGPVNQGIPIFVDNNGNVINSPLINTTTAQTTISARSGQTVVFAGLITKDNATTVRKVPLLGDVPVLGRLFRYDSQMDVRTELMIILTPYIIDDDEDLEWIKQVESERMNWCLADVVEVHGDIGVAERIGQGEFLSEGPTVIYPDANPTGDLDAPSQPLKNIMQSLPGGSRVDVSGRVQTNPRVAELNPPRQEAVNQQSPKPLRIITPNTAPPTVSETMQTDIKYGDVPEQPPVSLPPL